MFGCTTTNLRVLGGEREDASANDISKSKSASKHTHKKNSWASVVALGRVMIRASVWGLRRLPDHSVGDPEWSGKHMVVRQMT